MIRIGNIQLEHPIMNAAGPECKTLEQIEKLALSPVAAIMMGSITVEARAGNSGSVYWNSSGFSLNSLGLPCPSNVYYRSYLPKMADLVHGMNKPFFVSIAGFSPEEYGILTQHALLGGADIIELNLGCPNVWEGQSQKRIACFDKDAARAIFSKVRKSLTLHCAQIPLAVKVSPFSDPYALAEFAELLTSSDISAVTAVNTFPNAFAYDEHGKSAINTELSGGLAGLAGPALKPIGLGQVMQWRKLLPERIAVIGAGGISSGRDVYEYLQAGATAVQIATAYANRGVRVFSEILTEYVDLTEKKM